MKCFGFVKKSRSVGVRGEKSPAAARSIPCHGTGGGGNQSSSGDEIKTQHATTPKCRSMASLYEEKGDNLRVFDITELRNATNNFSRLLKIGEGGFGSVYRGFVRLSPGQANRTTVAIKKLKAGSLQGHKQWLTEVQFLGVADHPSLVRLIGYCSLDSERGIERLLVYEFMSNKSLEDHLFNRACPVLSWKTRLKIALSVAKGLSYLHEGLEVQVIYRDFKASNVLLDKDFNPKLSDFGLARQGPSDGRTHVTTAVVGTYGYACPDYIQTGHLTVKSDVWSFGVVLFEILTGRRCFDRMRPKSEQKLLEWVKQYPVESETFRMIMDPRLGNNYSISTARLVANLANTCLAKNRKERPSMSQVGESLQLAISS